VGEALSKAYEQSGIRVCRSRLFRYEVLLAWSSEAAQPSLIQHEQRENKKQRKREHSDGRDHLPHNRKSSVVAHHGRRLQVGISESDGPDLVTQQKQSAFFLY
jgi:hypothetical protein